MFLIQAALKKHRINTSVPVSYPSSSLEMKASALAALAAAFTSSIVQSFSPYSILYLSELQNSSGLWETDATWRMTHSVQQQAAKHVVLREKKINSSIWCRMQWLQRRIQPTVHFTNYPYEKNNCTLFKILPCQTEKCHTRRVLQQNMAPS